MNDTLKVPGNKITQFIELIEDGLIVTILIVMIVLATAQIFLRNFFDAGLLWADPLLRVMVLWLALLGALAASRHNKHIAIDLFSRLLSTRQFLWMQVFTSGFTACVCALVAFYAVRFVMDEYRFGGTVFAGLPSWSAALIVPLAFGLIALRYMLFCGTRIKTGLFGDPADNADH